MRRIRPAFVAATLLASTVVPGCASSGMKNPLANRTTVGTLKTSVAQLENEKEKFRRQAEELERENERLTSRLAEEREVNGELTARLDDARNLIGGNSPGTSRTGRIPTRESDAQSPAPRANRNPPFAQISSGPRDSEPLDPPARSGRSRTNEEDLPPPNRSTSSSSSSPGWLPVIIGSEPDPN